MSPIPMTREERRLLRRLFDNPLAINEIPKHVISKFSGHGLITNEVLRYRLTLKGQLETMRQRFRNMRRRRVVTLSGASFRERLYQTLAGRTLAANRSNSADEIEE